MGIDIIILYTMDDCQLCNKAKELLEHWNIRYIDSNIKPYHKRQYPYFDVSGKIYECEEIVDMIAKGKLDKFMEVNENE